MSPTDLDPLSPRERQALDALDHDREMVLKHVKRAAEEAFELGIDPDVLREMLEDEIAMEKAAREGSERDRRPTIHRFGEGGVKA